MIVSIIAMASPYTTRQKLAVKVLTSRILIRQIYSN